MTPSQVSTYAALFRVPQWTKNVFVLAPLFFSLQLRDTTSIRRSIGAFVLFCGVASVVYILNDWADRDADREHPVKRFRPIAAGAVDGRTAVVAAGAVLAVGVVVGLVCGLPVAVWLIVGSYAAINVAYSYALRAVELVDVAVIAAGFVLRVLAGAAAIEVVPSSWIILSTGLLALLLALGKRRVDLGVETASHRGALTGYTKEFIDAALATLAASVIAFYALFTTSDYSAERFRAEHLYLTTFFVALGVVRFLQLVIAYERHGSPTEIALRDRPIQVLVAGWLITFYVLAYHVGV